MAEICELEGILTRLEAITGRNRQEEIGEEEIGALIVSRFAANNPQIIPK